MQGLFRSLLVKAGLAGVVAAVAPIGLMAIAFHYWAEGPLTGEQDRKATAIGQAVKRQLERASDVGIPLADIRGVADFFQHFLDDNPEIRFMAVTAPDGRPLHYRGIDGAGLRQLLEPVDASFETRRRVGGAMEAYRRYTLGDITLDVRPIGPAGQPLALLHVATGRGFLAEAFHRNWREFALAAALGAAVGLALTLLLVAMPTVRRLRRFDRGVAEAGAGRPAAFDDRSGDEIGFAARAFDAVLHHLRGRYDAVLYQAEAARDGAVGRAVRDSLESIREQLRRELEPALGDIAAAPPTEIGRSGGNVSLRARVTLIASIGALLLAVGLGYGGILREKLLVESYEEDRQTALKNAWKTLSQRETYAIARLLAPLRESPDIRQALLAGDSLAAARIIDTIAARAGLHDLAIVDPSEDANRLFVEHNPVSPNLANRLAEIGGSASGADLDAERKAYWTVAERLGDPEHGAVLIVAASAALDPVVLETGTILGGEAFLTGGEGRLILGTDPTLWELLRGGGAPGDYASATVNVPALDGGRLASLQVVTDISELTARQHAMRIAFFGAAAIFASLALCGLYLYLRGSFRPLDRVIGVLEALSEGRRGVWIDQTSGADEISRIARAVHAYRNSLDEVARLSDERQRAQRRRERFLRRQMAGLTSTVGEEARQAVTDQLSALEQEGAGDEFEALTLVFEQMAGRIREQHGRLTELIEELREALLHKERLAQIESELSIAHDMQISVLPRETPPQRTVEIAAQMTPAKEVGGDFYDYFAIDERRIGVVIADVSGKGIPAAFFMLIARTLLKATALFGEPPGRVFSTLNDLLEADNEQMMFVTAFYAVIDTETGHVAFANAGHNPTYRIDAGGGLSTLPADPGLALAIMSGFDYREGETVLGEGETLFFYTDGVNEAFNEAGEQYGEPRLEETLSGIAGATPREICDGMLASVELFSAGIEQSDDITTVAVRYLGGGASAP